MLLALTILFWILLVKGAHMREDGRQRRLSRPAVIGLSAAVALALGGSLAATQAVAASAASTRPAGGFGALSISKGYFGSTIEPYTGKETPTYRYTMTNANGMRVDLLTYGAITQAIDVPGANGQIADVVLGFKTLQDYVTYVSPPVTANGGPYFGETVGRYGNRIAKGKFTLNQPGVGPVTYTLPVNNGVNSLHGGLVGFGNHIWSTVQVIDNRGFGASWTATVAGSAFTTGGGTPAETIPAANASYGVSALSQTTGSANFTFVPQTTLSTAPQAVVSTTNVAGNTSASWNPLIQVSVPEIGRAHV